MHLHDVVRARRMVRSYTAEPIPDPVLAQILDSARRAPSAGFSQGWDFVLLRTPADRDRFWAASTPDPEASNPWLTGMRSAPTLILCLSDPDRYLDRYAEPDKGWADRDPARWPVPYWDTDVAMAAMIILLSLTDAGYAGCFFGVPPQAHPDVREALQIPANRRIVGVISAGRAAPDRRSPSLRRGRRPEAEVVHEGRFARPVRWGAADAAAPVPPHLSTDPADLSLELPDLSKE